MSAYPSPRFLNITVNGTAAITGAATFSTFTASGRGQAQQFVIEAGAYSMTGEFSYSTTPFGLRMTIPRVDGASAPIGPRDLTRWSITADNSISWNSTNGRTAPLRAQSLVWRLGTPGIDPDLSWDGGRVGNIISFIDDSPPVSYTRPPSSPYAQPSLSGYWVGSNNRYPRGGTAPVRALAQGSIFHYYSSIILGGLTSTLPGARNYNHSRHVELGLWIRPGASTRLFTGIGVPIASLTGLIPPDGFRGISLDRGSVITPGFRTGYSIGGNAYAGGDPLTGVGVEWVASSVESRPTGRIGVDLLGTEMNLAAFRWTGGRIAGGALDDDDVGALEVGPARLAGTADGADLSATGHTGFPTRTFFDLGGDLVSGELGMAPEAAALFYDDLGGTYLGRSRYATGFTRIECLTPPTYFGSSPPATLSLRMRGESGGDLGYLVTESATTTSQPTMLTHDTVDAVVGMQVEYLSGPAAGEVRDITAYNPTTRIVTTDAFSTVPTATVQVITNPTLNLDPVNPSPDTVQNGWEWTVSGGTGTVTWAVGPPSVVTLTGDGTNAAALDQECTVTPAILYTVLVTHEQPLTLVVGTTRGDNDLGEFYLPYDVEPPGTIISSAVFLSGAGSTAWIRLQNTSGDPAYLDRVQMSASSSLPVGGIRARVIPQFLVINQTWTERSVLSLQKDGGAITLPGVQASTSYANDAAAAAGGVAVGQVYRNGSVVQVRIV